MAREELDHVEPVGDRPGSVKGAARQSGKQTRTPRRHRAVDDGEQAAAPLARKCRRELEVAPRRRIDLEHRPRPHLLQRLEARQLALLGELDVIEERPRGGELGAAEAAEAVERLDAIIGLEPAPAAVAVEARGGLRRGARTPVGKRCRERLPRQEAVREDELARLEARKRARERAGLDRLDMEVAGREVEPGKGGGPRRLGKGGEIIVPPRVEQAVLGERARCDDADHLAPHHRLAAAPPGLGRVLHLLAHGDPEALADQAREIGIGRVHRHAAHGDVLALVPAAFGEGDVERLRGLDRVLEEHLVEVAHAVEEETIRVRALDLEVLRHHGAGGKRRRLGPRRGGGCFAQRLRGGRQGAPHESCWEGASAGGTLAWRELGREARTLPKEGLVCLAI